MKKKLVFLWLLVFLMSATVIGQTLQISSSGYENQNVTDGSINVRSGTVVTIVATLPAGATQTYWTSSVDLIAIDPAQEFPIESSETLEVTFEMPANDEVIITVAFNTSPMTSSFVVLTRNDNVATGLLSNQAVSDCSGVLSSFAATENFLESFSYVWQEWNGSWVDLGSSSYYSAVGRILNVQLHSSIEGMEFRCLVTNPNCLGAVDEVLIEVVEVFELPLNQTWDTNNTKYCQGSEYPNVILDGSQDGFIYQLQIWETDTNVGDPVIGTGGPINITWPAGEYHLLVIDPTTGCNKKL
jgi:hypothetical protein